MDRFCRSLGYANWIVIINQQRAEVAMEMCQCREILTHVETSAGLWEADTTGRGVVDGTKLE